ncbi:MAG: hypothetical protein ACFFED_03135 [Candidatus Thorarchaeota archaeon]
MDARLFVLLLIFGQVPFQTPLYKAFQAYIDYWPKDSWRVSSLEEPDMNVQRIDCLTERLEEDSSVTSLLIIKNG